MAINGRQRVTECLAGRAVPPSSCPVHWHASCLIAHIPPWTATYERVRECFRCCMLGAASAHADQLLHWTRVLNGSFIGLKHGVDDGVEVLLGHNSDLRFASAGSAYGGKLEEAVPPIPSADGLMLAQNISSTSTYYLSVQGAAPPDYKGLHTFARQILAQPESKVPSISLFLMGDFQEPTKTKLASLLSEPRLRAWFVNNPRMVHPKLHAYPRGVHSTPSWRTALLRAGETRQLWRRRPNLLMCGCITLRGERATKLSQLGANGFRCTHAHCHQSLYMDLILNSTFVFSPWGTYDESRGKGGHNNHRDWEALLAGAIPLVDHDPNLAEMWEGLPVVQVRNWSSVTPARLRRIWQDVQGHEFNLAAAYFPRWLHAILGAEASTAHVHQPITSHFRTSPPSLFID